MVFVFDLDDTICETNDYSVKYINNFIRDYGLPYKQVETKSRFAEQQFNWSTDVANSWYKAFGDDMMQEFPCKPGAKEFLEYLHDEGHQIVICTARANDWHCDPEFITKQWLKENGIPYDKLYIGRADKETVCREVNADIFVDDDIKISTRVANYFLANKPNAKCFLMTSKYNKGKEKPICITRVDTFNELWKRVVIMIDNQNREKK